MMERKILQENFSNAVLDAKRRRLENAGEGEACKRCNCKKSKCLKLYCECFAAGVYCVEPCSCHDCFNKPVHEDTVLATRKQIESRNPLAFAPKVIRNSETIPETGDEGIKASNILLDGEMKPKISDFGTTRLFELGQTQGNTNCIAGTYFGVLVLEIVTGLKNSGFYQSALAEDLPSYAWTHWSEGTVWNS